jgi:hypothetical protein
MLSVFSYIEKSGVIGAPIEYKWTPYKDMEFVEKAPKQLRQLIDALSGGATLALALGASEWMIARLRGLSSYSQAEHYIDALWAGSISGDYLKHDTLPTPKDTGDPATGALRGLEDALSTVSAYVFSNHPDRGKNTAGLISLVRYTLPDPKPFDEWLQATLKRLSSAFPLQEDDPLGPIVPRDFLDPHVKLETKSVPKLVDKQLREIDYTGNPFLANPKEMKAAGFKGEPYRFK